MYKIIDENEEQKKYTKIVDKITPETLGLKPTNDFAQYAQQILIDENPEKVKGWIDKGSIGVMEAGERFAIEFNGTYDNVISREEQNADFLKKHPIIGESRSKTVDERIANNKKKIAERNNRVNNGTATILERISAAMDRWGENSYQAQVQHANQQAVAQMRHKDNPNYRYEPASLDRSGRVIYSEIDLRKKIKFSEALADSIHQGKTMPFLSGIIEGASAKKYREIAVKIKNGEAIRQDELDYFNSYIDRQNEEYVRGYTYGGQVGKTILPSLLAFGGEMALGGAVLKGIGLTGIGKASGLALGTNLLKSGKVTKNIAKGVAFTTGQLAEAGINATVTSAVNPTRLYATYQERRLNDQMKITDRGVQIFSESLESPAKAFIKSLQQVYISYFTENMGALIGAPFNAGSRALKSIGAKQFANIIKNNQALEKIIQRTSPIFAKCYEKLNKLPIKGKSVEWLKSQVKFDGFIEELGEEVLEDILNLAIGTNNEERSLENYVKKIVKTPDEWAVLCGVIALQGTMLSVAGNTLGDVMQKNGASFEDIAHVSMNSTEAEKIELIDEAIKRGDINIDENILAAVSAKNDMSEEFYNQAIEAGLSESQAMSAETLYKTILNNLGSDTEAIQNWHNKLKLVKNLPVESITLDLEKNYQKINNKTINANANIYYQAAAMKKSRFDNFADFYKDVLSKPKNTNNKEQFNVLTKHGLNIRIPHDTVIHDINRHKLSSDEWLDLLNNIDSVSYAAISKKKSRFGGTPVLLKVDTNNNSFGVVVETFAKNNPLISTVFVDTESNIQKWIDDNTIKNEAVPNGTKTTFLDIGLTNIITNINPKFKSKSINNKIYFQSAYHGTPHKFDKFSTENIGTSEGVQAHGWGLYFAKDKYISDIYRKELSRDIWKYKGKELKAGEIYYFKDLLENGKENRLNFLKSYIERLEREVNKEKENKKIYGVILNKLEYNRNLSEIKNTKQQIKIVKNIDISKIERIKGTGQLYKVDIPDISEMLDENKSFSEQPEKVQEAIKELAEDYPRLEYDIQKNRTGKDIYNTLSKDAGSEQDASMELNDIGIKGITYDGRQDGRCYVIFDDKVINVLETYYQENIPQEDLSYAHIQAARQYAAKKMVKYTQKKNINKNTKLTERQKRYRDIAYDILYTALSHSKNKTGKPLVKSKRELYMLLGNDHKRKKNNHGLQARVEKIESYIAELDDQFSAYNGFETAWSEFFTNTGISYDTQELGGDAKLAMQALDVIVNKKYLVDGKEMSERYDSIIDDYIRQSYYEQDYFINIYKAVPENKDSSNIMVAWLDWVEGQPQFLQEELINEWEKRTQNVEGYNEDDSKFASKTYADYLNIHNAKFLDKELSYRGYFAKLGEKNIISIMNSHDKSTILHEMAHLFLDGLNEMAKYDDEVQEKLNTVNKWLRASGNGEYTIKQQEKFARSFEAYLYTGKAPTNMLRQAFETFKQWLKEIYTNISLIPEADISKEAQEVFDLLFSHQEKDDKKSLDIYRKTKNIGVTKDKITNKNIDKKLDDTALRHRKVCYDILSAKTGKSVKYIKYLLENKSGKTDIYDKIKELEQEIDIEDNKISESGLMSIDLLEFFDNADLFTSGNDRMLARSAYETVVNKAYKQYYSEYDYVNEKSAQYYYLLKLFNNAPQEERTSVLGAFYMWCETLKGNDKELYLEKFMTDTAEIERIENMDEFERAKIRILEAAKKVSEQSLDKSEEYKQTVQTIFKELNCINNTDKARLLTNILDIPSYGFLEARINNVIDIAKTMEDVNTRRELIRKITKEIQGTKNIKKGYQTVGKYDYRTNKMFEQLRELDKLSSEQAIERLQNIREFTSMEDEGSSFEDKMYNRFLSYKANGINYSSTSNLSALYNDILKIKEAAANVKNEYELQQALNDGNDIQELVDILETKKKANGLVKFYNEALCDLESSLNLIFNNKIKDKYSMLYRGAMTSVWIENEKNKFKKGVQKIYGRKDHDWDNDLLKYLTPKETETYYIHRREWDVEGNIVADNTSPIELNRMHCILAYIWNKNEILHKRLVNMLGEQQLENMLGNLSKQDEQLGDFMQQMASSYYNQINNVFIKKYGIDLPKVSFYFPSNVERISEVDMFNDYTQKSLGRGFIKNRTTSERVIMDFQNPVGILFSHIEGAGKFINYSEFIDKTNRVFKDKRVESLIKYKFGKDGLKVLQQSLANVTYKSEAKQYNWFNKVLGNIASNWILSNIAIRPIVAIKQMLSCTNYAADMPVKEWIKGFVKAVANPAKSTKYIMNIPAIKARFETGGQNEALKDHLTSSLLAQTQTFKEWQSLNVRLGDVGAIIFGGKPYIDYLIKTGVPEDIAIQRFVELTMRTQQSSDISSLSTLQVEWSKNPIGKLFIAYRNAPIQYVRMAANSIVSYANGEMSKQQCAKVLFNFLVLQPFLYTVASSGSWLALALGTGGWNEILKDLLSSILTGNADALSLFGDLYSFAVNIFIFKEKGITDKVPLLSDLQEEMLKLSKKDITMQDIAGSLLEMVSKTTGFSINDVVNMAGGVGDVLEGKVIKGGLRMLGYTEYRAGLINGDKN